MTRRRLVATGLLALACALPPLALLTGVEPLLDGPVVVVLAVAASYAAGAWLPRVAAASGAVVLVADLVVVSQLHGAGYHPLDDLVFFAALVGGSAAAGAAVTTRAQQVARLEALRTQVAAQQAVEVEAARLEEQARLEHDVHAGLAERIAAIAVLAEGAGRTHDPGALAVIEAEARAVLARLREALGALGSDPPVQPGPVVPPVAPPGTAAATGTPAIGTPAGAGPVRPGRHVGRAAGPPVSTRDLLLAGVLLLALGVELAVSSVATGPLAADLLLATAVTAPLVLRRSRPLLAVVGFVAAGLLGSAALTPLPVTVTGVALLLVVFYGAGAWGGHRWWLPAGAALAGALAMLAVAATRVGTAPEAPWSVTLLGVVTVAAGRVTAQWQERVRRTEELLAELAAGRDAAVQLATARERHAVASRLHDTVAHAMTVVCVQAAGQRAAGAADRAAADDVLRTIATTAGASLAELRDGLEAMERGERPLDGSRIAAVGRRVGVDLDVRHATAQVGGPAAVLAFRVVRESVVNVARHAPGSTARVSVREDGAALAVEVDDDGAGAVRDRTPGASAAGALGSGSGLAGLREAVVAAGGRLEWGPSPGGGFRVRASIPTGAGGAA